MTCAATRSAISSPGSADGPSLCSGLDGLQAELFGREAHHASRFRRRGVSPEPTTSDTSGRSSTGLSPSAALQLSLGSRLRTVLDGRGSPLYVLTWSQSAMPSGLPIWRRRASARRIYDSGSSGSRIDGWPTPMTVDTHVNGNHSSTANAAHGVNGTRRGLTYSEKRALTASEDRSLNPGFCRWLMGYPDAWDVYAPTETPSSRKSRQRL